MTTKRTRLRDTRSWRFDLSLFVLVPTLGLDSTCHAPQAAGAPVLADPWRTVAVAGEAGLAARVKRAASMPLNARVVRSLIRLGYEDRPSRRRT